MIASNIVLITQQMFDQNNNVFLRIAHDEVIMDTLSGDVLRGQGEGSSVAVPCEAANNQVEIGRSGSRFGIDFDSRDRFEKIYRTGRSAMRISMTLLMLVLSACAPAQKNLDVKATTDLKETLTDYNMKMRWGLWDQAAQYVDPAFKQAFLGEMEARGDDYKIVGIESRNIIFQENTADVEYEMEWYTESMVVKKDKFVDRWIQVGGVWLRQETMTKEEWRKRKKEQVDAKLATNHDGQSATQTRQAEPEEVSSTNRSAESP